MAGKVDAAERRLHPPVRDRKGCPRRVRLPRHPAGGKRFGKP